MNAVTLPLAALATALTLVIATLPARAGAPTENGQAPQVVVRYADLDLGSDEGALTLYRRIAAAARDVCPDDRSRQLRHAQAVRACRDEAVARAISAVGSPRLAAIRAARTSRARVGQARRIVVPVSALGQAPSWPASWHRHSSWKPVPGLAFWHLTPPVPS